MLHRLPPYELAHVLKYSQTDMQTGYKGSMKGGGDHIHCFCKAQKPNTKNEVFRNYGI